MRRTAPKPEVLTRRLTKSLGHALESARRAYRTQLRLQQVYADRYELTGRETVAATRGLRWHGDHLVGCELPPQT